CFVYTPLISYVSARMEGVVGQSVQVPFVREAAFIFSGYRGAAIWFAPFPMHNYGAQTLYFRKTELTGTKILSMVKAELFIFPIILISTVVFSHFIWKIGAVPSSALQFAQAFHPGYLLGGLGLAVLLYLVLSGYGLPVLLFYGIIRGLDQASPHVV